MPVTIHNKTDRPVMIRLNSGRTLYLAARGASEEITEVEIVHNPKIIRQQSRNVIELRAREKDAGCAAKTVKKSPKTARNRKTKSLQ